ncbi:hypothetical protein PR003_g24305 [Phytophthora rubi]|uniref:beta-glucosidase n=1 Tax=Phytophthora rubi TaxID=129364 RepID=A0A6A3IYV0_9STRA|nr:hypothetical protein PR001_g23134 [Phytophthora rubi]KAE9294227.1 hypothetical protein PR003_g24305 [Phytophthora rubi]
MKENGGHPMIYGTDSVHGNVLVMETVFFGQQIDGAAAFNHDLLYEQDLITARNTLAAGIPWTFDPVLNIMHNPSVRQPVACASTLVAEVGTWQENLSTAVDLWGKLAYAQRYLAVPIAAAHEKSLVGVSERDTDFVGVVICVSRYKAHQTLEPLPSLRVSVTAIHSPKDLEAACKIISAEAMATVKDLPSGSHFW